MPFLFGNGDPYVVILVAQELHSQFSWLAKMRLGVHMSGGHLDSLRVVHKSKAEIINCLYPFV